VIPAPSRNLSILSVVQRYISRWRQLNREARLYLLHAALLTGSLAIIVLLFNVAIEPLGFDIQFLGRLNELAVLVAAVLSVPLWWLVSRIGLRPALFSSALLQAASALLVAFWPVALSLQLSVALTGVAAVLFQVSAPPFMMQQSNQRTRDHLFSANTAINLGLGGLGSLVAGRLPRWLGAMLGVGAESALAYRATFAVAGVGLILSIVPLLLIRRQQHTANGADTQSSVAVVDNEAALDHPELDTSHIPPQAERPFWLARQPIIARLIAWLPTTLQDLVRFPWPVLQLLVSPLLISLGAALLMPYLNLFFKARFVIGDNILGNIFAALGIVMGAAALAAPLISNRIGKIRTVVLTQLLSIPFLLLLGFAPFIGIAVLAALARGALFNMGSPLYDAFAMERTPPATRPIVIGLINGAYTVGYLVTPRISTAVQASYGFSPLFVTTCIFYSLAIFANYWLFIRPDPQRILRPRAGSQQTPSH